jgi:hypothetical protein
VAGRRTRVPRPAVGEEWELRFLKNPAVKGWDDLCQQQPEAAARAFDFLRADPRLHTDRNHRLKGELGSAFVGGRELERWQHEVTSSGRIFYLIDDQNRTVWFEVAGLGHPKITE